MKITVLHGQDSAAARKRFTHIIDTVKKRNWEVVNVGLDQSIPEKLSHTSLFGNDQLFVLEDAGLLDVSTLEWLCKNAKSFESNFLIYHDDDLPKKVLDGLPPVAKFEKFDVPKTIFVFLESIRPGNSKTAIKLLHQCVKSDPVEMIFSLIGTLFRDLYWVKTAPQSLSLPGWRLNKLKNQANTYSSEKIVNLIDQLAEIDIKTKTSSLELLPSLDLILARELQ